MSTRSIHFVLNGRYRTLRIDDQTLLLDLVRHLGLTGAKPSCEMQVCGACTLLLDGLPVSSCCTLAAEADGRSVETVEGLAKSERLDTVQEAFLECFAFQCGYCTPGMIMTAKALLATEPRPDRATVVDWMDGNICRCTGYESIVQAVLLAAARSPKGPTPSSPGHVPDGESK